MASIVMSAICSELSFQGNRSLLPRKLLSRYMKNSGLRSGITGGVAFSGAWEGPFRRLTLASRRDFSHFSWPVSAVGSGLEVSITDEKKNDISLDNVKIVVESRDDDKIHQRVDYLVRQLTLKDNTTTAYKVRVDLTKEETQKAFDDVLTNLARTAPPIPGFRRKKGGKTSNVPKSFLLQVLGRDRVTKFLIQEIVSSAIGDYVKKEKLTVKSQFKTAQTADELESAFTPGSEFSFNATMDIIKSEPEETDSSSS